MSKLKHVAIIMDGNGRWAQARRRPRVWGHVRGSAIVTDIVVKANDLGIEALTLYAFSTENWNRPAREVSTLFLLLKKFLLKERKKIIKNKVQFEVIGDFSNLPKDTIDIIHKLTDETKNFTGLKLSFAFGYGGRAEIVDSINTFINDHPGQDISVENITRGLYRPSTGDVDLLIRTGGDQRISNFLLWQCAYAELYFTETKWPEFSVKELEAIVKTVENRERRFGGLVGDSRDEQSIDSISKIALTKKNLIKNI
jgi:undecaprenyl diphosphate synthase